MLSMDWPLDPINKCWNVCWHLIITSKCRSSGGDFNCWLDLISESSKLIEWADVDGTSRLDVCDGEDVDGVDMSGWSDDRDSLANLRFFSGVTKSAVQSFFHCQQIGKKSEIFYCSVYIFC